MSQLPENEKSGSQPPSAPRQEAVPEDGIERVASVPPESAPPSESAAPSEPALLAAPPSVATPTDAPRTAAPPTALPAKPDSDQTVSVADRAPVQLAEGMAVGPASPIGGPGAPDPERVMRGLSRRSFLWAGAAALGVYSGWHWLISRPDDNGLPWPMRRVLDFNADFANDYFSTMRLAPTFPVSRRQKLQHNGDYGVGPDFDPSTWKLKVTGLASGTDLELTLDDIKSLPHREQVTEFKCIEGWSYIVQWGGVRLSDFMARYGPATQSGDPPEVMKKPQDLVPYVGMATPDGAYYISLDVKSALHPQTLLTWEMNGEPLTLEHGAPLRLVIPCKYGVKHLKRIGTITFAAERPADFWAEQGYDWYVGH